MDSSSSNDDDEPKVCTVFSSSDYDSRTVFDTIAFSAKKDSPTNTTTSTSAHYASRETSSVKPPENFCPNSFEGEQIQQMQKSESTLSLQCDDLQNIEARNSADSKANLITAPEENDDSTANENLNLPQTFQSIDRSSLSHEIPCYSSHLTTASEGIDEKNELPMAKELFADTPEVGFPVSVGLNTAFEILPEGLGESQHRTHSSSFPTQSNFPTPICPSNEYGSNYEASYDAWILSEDTKQFLFNLHSQSAGSLLPDKGKMTLPGIIYEDEFVDKVQVNMQRIFGENEANKRKILSADSVSQDDNGLLELIKLGCYRSALNLTKRLLTLVGQGPGKTGHFSKHSPYTLQLWFSRISLLVRIREFTVADTEVAQFDNFEKPDMFYEYYPDSCGGRRRGSMVPFYFRMLACEIPQYLRRSNETIEKLSILLATIGKILYNLDKDLNEDGTSRHEGMDSSEYQLRSVTIWKARKIRILYALVNASLFSKQYQNAFVFLTDLCTVDKDHESQLKSAIGRLFLQCGDLPSAQKYFLEASELRTLESGVDHVNTLVDSALMMIAQNSFAEALDLLKQSSSIQPDNFMILNNMAVCLLYLGKVKESLSLMDRTVKQNIPQSLQENVLLNLSSIYELENTDGSKKNSLLKILSEYKGDGINLASLKNPNLI